MSKSRTLRGADRADPSAFPMLSARLDVVSLRKQSPAAAQQHTLVFGRTGTPARPEMEALEINTEAQP